MLSDLVPGQKCDVSVKAYSGDKFTHPTEGPVVSCIIESELSNVLSVSPAAPPDAVKLKLVSITTDGIELTWPFPRQYGDALLTGYQMVKNGKLSGQIGRASCRERV